MPSPQMALPMFGQQETRKRHFVPDTSKAAHVAAVNAGRITGRKADVLQWLGTSLFPVTAAELSMAVYADHTLDHVLHIRRGLSDLKAAGLAEKSADRLCHVTKTKANTWKVITR